MEIAEYGKIQIVDILFEVCVNFFKKLVGVFKGQPNQYGLDNLEDDVIGYPPNPKGIPVVRTDVLVERMMNDVLFIKGEIGMTYDDFDKYITPTMLSFVELVDLLPASEYKHHVTGGGLLYHSFDVAKRAMRSAQQTQFPALSGMITNTQLSAIHWKAAAVLTSLLHDAGKVVADMTISNGEDGDGRKVWDAYSGQTINSWAKEEGISRYYVSWNSDRHQKHKTASIAMMQRLIPKETLSWLAGCPDGKYIYQMMQAAINNSGMDHPLCTILEECDAASTREDMLHRSSHTTKDIKRVELSVIFAETIKYRVSRGDWSVNKRGAKVWFVDNQLYLCWTSIVPEVVSELIEAGYHIPDAPDVLARIMIEEGLARPAKGSKLYFNIQPETLGTADEPVTLSCLKVRVIERVIGQPDKLYSISSRKSKTTEQEATKAEAPLPSQSDAVKPEASQNTKPKTAEAEPSDAADKAPKEKEGQSESQSPENQTTESDESSKNEIAMNEEDKTETQDKKEEQVQGGGDCIKVSQSHSKEVEQEKVAQSGLSSLARVLKPESDTPEIDNTTEVDDALEADDMLGVDDAPEIVIKLQSAGFGSFEEGVLYISADDKYEAMSVLSEVNGKPIRELATMLTNGELEGVQVREC